MTDSNILIIKAMSPLHNGAGESAGIIDRPIIRERSTKLPFVQSASIKGVLRSMWPSDSVKALFGPEPGEDAKHGGAVDFGDGRLVAFPIRCLNGPFVWATSPLLLYRFAERLAMCEHSLACGLEALASEYLPISQVVLCEDCVDLSIGPPEDRRILMEEYSLAIDRRQRIQRNIVNQLAALLFMPRETFLKGLFQKRLVILPDKFMIYFATHATEVVPNIRIGEKGVTVDGSLRYTEYLPEDTILYSFVQFQPSRGVNEMSASQVATKFRENMPERVQLGADETIGKGLVRLLLQ